MTVDNISACNLGLGLPYRAFLPAESQKGVLHPMVEYVQRCAGRLYTKEAAP
jgi:hypothetical protein